MSEERALRVGLWLDEIEAQVRGISSSGIAHDGDCGGSLCSGCGHCLHSVETCSHDCEGTGGGGCAGAVDDYEVIAKRSALGAVATLRSVLQVTRNEPEPLLTTIENGLRRTR